MGRTHVCQGVCVTVMLKCGYFNWKNQISFWTFFGGETKKLNP